MAIKDPFSLCIAAYAALLSTGLAIIKLLEFRDDRGRLAVKLIWDRAEIGSAGHVAYSEPGSGAPALHVTNRGRRKIQVVGLGAVRRGKSIEGDLFSNFRHFDLAEGAQVTLPGGEITGWVRDRQVTSIFVRDSLSRDWSTGRRALRAFRRIDSARAPPELPKKPPQANQ